ncbi:MAG: hypothetical protein IH957_03940 [Chloroflexi bacterium]|nr:hypothetical protein [Chloroflexota bacterium]
MPPRRLVVLSTAVVVAALGTAIVLLLAIQSDDTSALPGVPASHLREQQLEIELADAAGFVVPPDSAREIARSMLNHAEISETIPVIFRSELYPVFDGFAWAIVFDTSTGSDTPFISGPALRGYVMTTDDYFVAFIDGECGFFLRVLAPGSDYSRFPPIPPGVDYEGRRHPTAFCAYVPAPAP